MLQKLKLNLPPREGNGSTETLEVGEPVVIIGANGVGKSKLGFWIELNQQNPKKVHRISAQKILTFPQYVQQKNLEQAQNELLMGISSLDFRPLGGERDAKITHRWGVNANGFNFDITSLLNDYEKVLSLLFAKKSKRDSELAKRVKEMKTKRINERPEMPESPDEILLEIWKDIFPHRQIVDKSLLKMVKSMFLYLLMVIFMKGDK